MTESSARQKRDRHPARSARIIATGISVSGLVSMVTAFNVQALRQTTAATDTSTSINSLTAPALAPLVQAPSSPRPAQAVPVTTPAITTDTSTLGSTVVPVAAPSRVVLEVPPIASAPAAPSAVSSGSH